MDGAGVTQIQHIEIAVFVINDSAITEVDPHNGIRLGAGYALDITDITVVDVFTVLDLHDLITGPEAPLTVYSIGFTVHRRIDLALEPLIQCVGTRFRLLTVWGQQYHIIDAVFRSFLQVQRFDNLSRYRKVSRVVELKIRAVLQGQIAVADQLGISGTMMTMSKSSSSMAFSVPQKLENRSSIILMSSGRIGGMKSQ